MNSFLITYEPHCFTHQYISLLKVIYCWHKVCFVVYVCLRMYLPFETTFDIVQLGSVRDVIGYLLHFNNSITTFRIYQGRLYNFTRILTCPGLCWFSSYHSYILYKACSFSAVCCHLVFSGSFFKKKLLILHTNHNCPSFLSSHFLPHLPYMFFSNSFPFSN